MTDSKSFIEVQFPVSKVSKESYKERKAGQSQTLTGLGKWWGRKPLILVRSALLGLLMPSGDNPQKDREIFLKILSMDEQGLWLRKNKPIKKPEIKENLTVTEIEKYFAQDDFVAGLSNAEKQYLQKLVFERMSYDDKLTYCLRPEELVNISENAWQEINEHLGTKAGKLSELIQELGQRIFGKTPSVGDCFCGGGSIPFEAARMGCEVYASDLNPLAGLLTWASLNILSLPDDEIQKLKNFQEKVFDEVSEQIDEWGIEKNEKGWMAKYYLYCNETVCLECKTKVPLSPSWEISRRGKVWAMLEYNENNNNFDIDIISVATEEQIEKAKSLATIDANNLYCPKCKNKTPISVLRKDRKDDQGKTLYGLRKWEKNDITPRADDVFQERLYCIKYLEKKENKTWKQFLKKPAPATDASYGTVHYVRPDENDLKREDKVLAILTNNFNEWIKKGYLPDSPIIDGSETSRLKRERGWQYWHQLFNPRQLLLNGLLFSKSSVLANCSHEIIIACLGVNGISNRNSKLIIWNSGADKSEQTFANQALNTLFNYATRPLSAIYSAWKYEIRNSTFHNKSKIQSIDARKLNNNSLVWITDPPYADAVNYHELSEFFLAWDKPIIEKIFPDWYTDSKRVLAVKGTGESFNQSMVEIYKNLADKMPENGMQIVMFTHQDPSVWADLTLILWSAGLQVTAAWNIATETESGGLKEGNYVKGTVLLVLRKQTSTATAYLDQIYPEVEYEVKSQIDSMHKIDDKEEPNFSDADYILAAFAASLKVLTSYKHFEDLDVEYELHKARDKKTVSPIEKLIHESVKTAYDYLIPAGFDSFIWKNLQAEERFYIKGIELEKNNIKQLGAYQEMARGFGVSDYKDLLSSKKANQVCLNSAQEFGSKQLKSKDNFSNSLIRHVLMAINQSLKADDANSGKNWLRNECYGQHWNDRPTIIALLEYFSILENFTNMTRWHQQSQYAKYIKELVKSDGV